MAGKTQPVIDWQFFDAKSYRWFSANATCQMARNGSSLMQSHDLGNLRYKVPLYQDWRALIGRDFSVVPDSVFLFF